MAEICRVHDLGQVNLTAFVCLLSIELTEAWPHLARRIDTLSRDELRLLQERMPGHPGPKFTAAQMRAVVDASGPLPLSGRFVRPLRQHLVMWLRKGCPNLARKVANLSEDGFEWLCQQLRKRR
jgi:hypothetical protein